MKCPYCAEEIQDEAIVCRHCGRDFILTKPLYDRLKSVEDKLLRLEGDFLELASKIEDGAGNPGNPRDQQKHKASRIIVIELFLYACLHTLLILYVAVEITFYTSIVFIFSPPFLLGLFFGYKWGNRNLLTLGLLILAFEILTSGIYSVGSPETHWTSRLWWYDPTNIIRYPIIIVLIIGRTLFLISSAFIGDRIFRWMNPHTKRMGLAGKVANSIARRAPTNATTLDRAETIRAYLLAVAPILTLIGTIIGALLTFLGTIFRPK